MRIKGLRPGLRASRLACLGGLALLVGCGDSASTGSDKPADYPRDGALRLNHIQVLGSHNSYHIQPKPDLFAAIEALVPPLAAAWEYTHLPLDQQFSEQGIRQIEIDVFADPDGGLYASRGATELLTGDGASGVPDLDAPGLKVLHVQDLDFESTFWTFVQGLETIRRWSEANPTHAPLTILIEAKDDTIDAPFDTVIPIPFDGAQLGVIDDEIWSVFEPGHVITPDEVRGDHATLEQAILQDGWPTLGDSRGRVLFALDNGGGVKEAYVDGHPSLRGRVLFVSAEPGEDEAAFVKLNDPIGSFDRIQELVGMGFIVRTRADGDTEEARTGDTTKRDAAIESGAQLVSSDYPVANLDFGTGYFVEIPGGTPGRCNPLSAPAACDAGDIEHPAAP
ncbi:MAG: phosphatidylinositol-specific phospholipase C1-like protein [Candidatus Binatia bacterium]|nr:phosphatidylinositol-specific phospholipase C1-like protein [Candidatus Binatia bacterium]